MTENNKTSQPKSQESYDSSFGTGISHLRNIKSSDGSRTKVDSGKPQPKHFLLNDPQILERPLGVDQIQPSPNANQKYRIKTSQPYHSALNKLKQERGLTAHSRYSDQQVGSLSQNRVHTTVGDKDAFKVNMRVGAPDIEKLHEESLQLKKTINILQEENIKLKTKNTNLEREAYKFEKMFQEASTNPKKKKALAKIEEGNGPALKQMIRDLKGELEDKDDELTSLKQKVKVTKIHELEIQLNTFQEECMKLRVYIEEQRVKYQDMLRSEEGKKITHVTNAEIERLQRDLKKLENSNRFFEIRLEESQRNLSEQEKKLKKDQTQLKKQLQLKEKEIVKLKSQVFGAAVANPGDKSAGNQATEENFRKELEKTALENLEFKQQLEEKNEYIAKLEKQLNEKGISHKESNHTSNQHSKKEFLLDQNHIKKEEPSKSSNTSERSNNTKEKE